MTSKTVDDVPRKCDESSSFLHLHKWIGLFPHSSSIGSNMRSSDIYIYIILGYLYKVLKINNKIEGHHCQIIISTFLTSKESVDWK